MESVIKPFSEKNQIGVHDQALVEHSRFQPYDQNGGTTIAIAGQDYAIIGSDTRLVNGYSIYSREQSKIFKINEKTILGSTVCWCDVVTFKRILELRSKMYKFDHNQDLSCAAIAQLVSIMLYNRRFFPYYVCCTVAGLDEQNRGHVYSYDSIGSFDDKGYCAEGEAKQLILSFLDNQVGKKTIENRAPNDSGLSLEEAMKILKDGFIAATERHITCGDSIHIYIVTKDGVREERFDLRKD